MFDTALVESARRRSLGGRRVSLPVAIAAHAAIVGAFVGASVWYVGEPPEPEQPVVFVSFGGPPPPPQGGGAVATVRSHVPRTTHSDAATQVTTVPDQVPVPADEGTGSSTSAEPGDGIAGAPPGPGVPDGIPGGTGEDPAGGPGPGEEILPAGIGGVTVPELIERVEPGYPQAAVIARLQGTVVLQAVITADGAVDEVRVLKSANPMLDASALAAVRQWRYRPATLRGRAVSVYLTVTVTFGLKS